MKNIELKSLTVITGNSFTDIVTSICYQIYVSNTYSEKVLFLNKANRDSIEKVFVDEYGKFVNENKSH